MNPNKPTISVVIPARNEQDRLPACLAALKGFAEEVIIVDDRSADGTADVARSFGARVISAPQCVDGRQTVEAVTMQGFKQATGDWVLRIDADEHMTPTLAQKLLEVIESDPCDGVCFARKNMMFGDWARHGGWFVSDQLRFFRRSALDLSTDWRIHEPVPVRGTIICLPKDEDYATVHHDYDSIHQFVDRSLFKYAYQEATERFKGGRRFSVVRAVIKPIKRAAGRYVVRQGFRDGRRGLVLAMLLGAYEMCVEFYLWDQERDQERGQLSCA